MQQINNYNNRNKNKIIWKTAFKNKVYLKHPCMI